MNGLNYFFDWDGFSLDKTFQVVSLGAWKDFKDKNIVYGSQVCCVITEDETDYNNPETTNLFEKIYFKIRANLDIVSKYVKLGAVVSPVDVEAHITGKPSGTYVNYGLSVEVKGFNDEDGKKII